jgi:glycosyltransferase involved in cell wall biosynthesis
MQSPISVVIPTYRRPQCLAEALQSVARQTLQPLEIIVVDDEGGTTRTQRIADDFGARLIASHRGGPSRARNLGIQAARGIWIALLDDDDLWEMRKLEFQWAALSAAPQAIGVFADFTRFDPDGRTTRPALATEPYYEQFRTMPRRTIADGVALCEREALQRALGVGNVVSQSSLVARRDCMIEAGLFDPQLDGVEGWEFAARLFRLGDAVVVERPLGRQRVHEVNVSSGEWRSARGIVTLAERVCDRPANYDPAFVAAFAARHGRPEAVALSRAFSRLRWGGFGDARTLFGRVLRRRFCLRAAVGWLVAALAERIATPSIRACVKALRRRVRGAPVADQRFEWLPDPR